MTKDPGFDHGLLSPSSAGRPIEAVTDDEAVLQAMLDAEAALVRAQAQLGVVPDEHATTITAVAGAGRLDLDRIARRGVKAGNPVDALVAELTAAVTAVDPAAAEYVHRGSTAQDILDTGLMLVADRALRLIDADLAATADALAALAARHRATAMPGRALTQHGAPITFGLKAAGWLTGVLDARRRLRSVLDGGLPVQLGGEAGTLGGYLEYARLAGDSGEAYAARLIRAFAEEVTLAEPALAWHTVRTPLHEIATAASLTTGVLGALAADVQVMTRTEIGELAEPAPPGGGLSCALPHRRQPVLATRIRTAATQVPLLAASVAHCLVAEDERPGGAWHAEWQPLREALRLAGGAADAAAELTEGLTVFPARMRANLDVFGQLAAAGRLAVWLGPPFGPAVAEEIVVDLALRAHQRGKSLRDVATADPRVADVMDAGRVAATLDPAGYVGAAGELVDRVLHRYHEGID
ncbi:lyase family protein [Actinoplanes teichomyceticus]|uniref:3-carboxy-cis,cis-muconate cycloisomerase n=1 Tax=Actinoplanes teichomyceticus TaxID=1867 RepID=A0A561WBN6_ACTTI|nr:lyase family protein [Actinoplanes teichomyceticus]TWG21269.1 3-carboxy-cis,cis-muconate cycloisomerase [Actinoplanes teichomyceticus]GIF16718.1 putative 3-carboxymuconate cycloisomerase (PcaB) [Actinoplanes teichomyceticus]